MTHTAKLKKKVPDAQHRQNHRGFTKQWYVRDLAMLSFKTHHKWYMKRIIIQVHDIIIILTSMFKLRTEAQSMKMDRAIYYDLWYVQRVQWPYNMPLIPWFDPQFAAQVVHQIRVSLASGTSYLCKDHPISLKEKMPNGLNFNNLARNNPAKLSKVYNIEQKTFTGPIG